MLGRENSKGKAVIGEARYKSSRADQGRGQSSSRAKKKIGREETWSGSTVGVKYLLKTPEKVLVESKGALTVHLNRMGQTIQAKGLSDEGGTTNSILWALFKVRIKRTRMPVGSRRKRGQGDAKGMRVQACSRKKKRRLGERMGENHRILVWSWFGKESLQSRP